MATGWKIVAAFIASLSFATLYKVQVKLWQLGLLVPSDDLIIIFTIRK